jgi:hypothetical protein
LTSNGRTASEGAPTIIAREIETIAADASETREEPLEGLTKKEKDDLPSTPENDEDDEDDETIAKKDPMRRKGDSAMYAYFMKSAGWFNSISFFVALAGYAFCGTFPCEY